jgi:hypothetical protein
MYRHRHYVNFYRINYSNGYAADKSWSQEYIVTRAIHNFTGRTRKMLLAPAISDRVVYKYQKPYSRVF